MQYAQSLAMLASLCTLAGCANITSTPHRESTVVRQYTKSLKLREPEVSIRAGTTDSQSLISVSRTPKCRDMGINVVEESIIIKRSTNRKALVAEWVAGGALLLIGAVLFAVSPSLSDEREVVENSASTASDPEETLRASDREVAYVFGGITVAGSLPLLGLGLANTIRQRDSVEVLPQKEIVAFNKVVKCGESVPFANAKVEVVGERPIYLGVTDSDGLVTVFLSKRLPLKSITNSSIREKVEVQVEGISAGELDITEYYSGLETQSWEAAKSRDTIESYQQFLTTFPWSNRSKEAKRRISKRQAWLKKAAEEASLERVPGICARTTKAFREYMVNAPPREKQLLYRVLTPVQLRTLLGVEFYTYDNVAAARLEMRVRSHFSMGHPHRWVNIGFDVPYVSAETCRWVGVVLNSLTIDDGGIRTSPRRALSDAGVWWIRCGIDLYQP